MYDRSTTVTGILKGIGVATATIHLSQDELTFWLGLMYAALTAIQGYLTNK